MVCLGPGARGGPRPAADPAGRLAATGPAAPGRRRDWRTRTQAARGARCADRVVPGRCVHGRPGGRAPARRCSAEFAHLSAGGADSSRGVSGGFAAAVARSGGNQDGHARGGGIACGGRGIQRACGAKPIQAGKFAGAAAGRGERDRAGVSGICAVSDGSGGTVPGWIRGADSGPAPARSRARLGRNRRRDRAERPARGDAQRSAMGDGRAALS
jgi:hypothetical protein